MNSSEPGLSGIIPQLILIGVLTLMNAFFASAEMAIVSVNKTKIKQLGDKGNQNAKLVERLLEDPSNFLSTIQIGITLAGFFSSASAATGISSYLQGVLMPFNIPYLTSISLILVTFALSYITLIFGELVPKRIALKNAEKIALSSVKPIYYISIFTKPFVKVLSMSTSVILKIIGNSSEDVEEKITEEEIKALIAQSHAEGSICLEERRMIDSVFQFNDKSAKEIMTPRNDTFAININDDINQILDEILNYNYSRVPVYKDSVDDIIGILYTKDLLLESRRVGFDKIDLEKILHKPYFVPETKKTNELFKLLQQNKIHLALLIDEYGGFSGVVSIEDLVEEIMGEIEDEYDQEAKSIKQINNNTYNVKGTIPLCEFNTFLSQELEEGEYDTLNGYLLTHIGEIPKENFELSIDNINFKILKIKKRRIEDIEVEFLGIS